MLAGSVKNFKAEDVSGESSKNVQLPEIRNDSDTVMQNVTNFINFLLILLTWGFIRYYEFDNFTTCIWVLMKILD